jgi:hypothetical protein
MPVIDEWDEQAADWRPDEWDRRVHAVLDYRDRVGNSVDGPVPAFGSPEWVAAGERTQAAAYARHEREVAAAQGVTISNRMADVSARREAQGDAEKAIAAEWARRRYSDHQLRPSTREQRVADREHRAELPKPWEDGYADSFPTDTASVPAPRQPTDGDTRGSVQHARTATACARARHATSAAVTTSAVERAPHRNEASRDDAHTDVDARG